MPESRVLTVSFVPGVTPGKWVRRWEERMPQVPLVAVPVSEAEQVRVLHTGRADMGFVRLPVDREGLSLIPLYAEIPVVVAPKDHEVAVFDEVPVTELAAEYLLQDPELFPEWRDISDEIHSGTRLPLPPIGSLDEALDLVEAGTGILILPMSVARQFSRKTLRYRPVTGIAPSQVGLAWPAGEPDPVLEEFIGVVRGRSALSSRQPSVQAAQDAAPKKVRGDKAGTGGKSAVQRGAGGGKSGTRSSGAKSTGAKSGGAKSGNSRSGQGKRGRR
ncbi:LysR family substrate-binding domain-containing protein [Paenarthrobacter sp. Z7-10]|nr:LysR family substrate-binding domain-containing protein [Paenarthrobacter sp. Z7-10]